MSGSDGNKMEKGRPPRRIGLFGNPEKTDIEKGMAQVQTHCREAGVSMVATEELAGHCAPDVEIAPSARIGDVVDMVVVFGGDGTMLRAVRTFTRGSAPLLGINLGALGYLTDIYLRELPTALDHVLAGEFQVVRRTRIRSIVKRDGREVADLEALNDIVVNMGAVPRALSMEVRVDRATLGTFMGDGLIVSTPTGSTAYNLSAGGPIVHPGVSGYLVTPICPHSLAIRPLLVPENKRVELRLIDSSQGATLSADGQESCELGDGDRIVYQQAETPALLVKAPRRDFFRAMRRKLQWGAIKRRHNQK